MNQSYFKLQGSQTLIAQHRFTSRDGERIVAELIQNSATSVILSHTFLDDSGVAIKTNSCGYCDGVLVGCVDCPNNDPFLDCVNHTISCQS